MTPCVSLMKYHGFSMMRLFFVQQHHVHKHVARPQFAVGHGLLLVAHFDDFFHRHQDFLDEVLHLVGLDALLDAFLDLLFLAGKRLDDEPLVAHDVQSLKKIAKQDQIHHRKRTRRASRWRWQ